MHFETVLFIGFVIVFLIMKYMAYLEDNRNENN